MAKETNYTPQEKKTLRKMFWNSGLVFCGFNMVKMEGNAFALTMEPALDELYDDKKEKAEAMRRHNGFFNTHAVFLSLIAGISYGLYAKSLGGGSVDPSTGDFNFSVREGYLIKDGKISKPVKGATLIGNGADVLMKIDMVGKNVLRAPGMCGASSGSIPTDVGQPPLRVSAMIVGGKEGGSANE